MVTRRISPKVDLAKVLNKSGYATELVRLQKQEAEARSAKASRLLLPGDVSGDYDAARALMTTLGGQRRLLTAKDLRAFEKTAKALGKKFKGGITAKGAIDLSRQIDLDRSNEQIRTAVVTKAAKGTMLFVTNAGPGSVDTRHFVKVQFPGFPAFAAAPVKPENQARPMLDGPLRFECSCKHFRFFLRYVATVGGFVHGREETAFPRIRNPELAGVACKHALRVMVAIRRDATVRAQAAKMIAAAQANNTKAVVTTAAEAKSIAEKQLQQSKYVRNQAETTKQAEARRALSATTRGKVKAIAAATASARKKQDAKEVKAEAAVAKMMRSVKLLGLTPAQVLEFVSRAAGVKS